VGVPGELLALAREALILNPYLAPWLAAVASKSHGVDPKATSRRMVAEAALRFGVDAVYDGRTAAFQSSATARARSSADLTGQLAADQIRRFSLVAGVDPDPVGVTAWSQPWIPLWLEWEALVEVSDRLDGWRLGPVDDDLDPDDAPPTTARTLRGRCPVTTGTAVTLGSAVCDWLVAEDQRDRDNKGEADEATEAALARIADGIEHLDVLAASLDGIREQLLGFVYDGGLVRRRKGDGTLDAPEKSGARALPLCRSGGGRPGRCGGHRRSGRSDAHHQPGRGLPSAGSHRRGAGGLRRGRGAARPAHA